MRRGEVWGASLPPPADSGPGSRRPVIVLQSDPFNQSRIRTVVVAAATSNLRLADAPGNVLLAQGSRDCHVTPRSTSLRSSPSKSHS